MLRAILLFLTLLSHGKKSFKFLFNISRINRSSSGILSARPSTVPACPSAVPSCRTFLFFLRCPSVVLFPLLFIAQNPVCLSDFLKPFLCPLISRMCIGVAFFCRFSICLFYGVLISRLRNPLIPDMDSYLFQPFIHGNRKPVKCAFYCRFKAQAVLFADNLRPAVMLNNFLLPLQKRICLSSV